jgi:hypothetical protein
MQLSSSSDKANRKPKTLWGGKTFRLPGERGGFFAAKSPRREERPYLLRFHGVQISFGFINGAEGRRRVIMRGTGAPPVIKIALRE